MNTTRCETRQRHGVHSLRALLLLALSTAPAWCIQAEPLRPGPDPAEGIVDPQVLKAQREGPIVHALSVEDEARALRGLACTRYCGTPVSYTSWRGNTVTLQQYLGTNVRVLVPPHWYDDPTFTEDARRQFIDSFDLTFAYLSEQIGRTPPGTERIPIAFVDPPGCGQGCGVVGGRGIEFKDEPDNADNRYFWTTALQGLPTYGLVHELTHNFDSYASAYSFAALPDAAHYWTYNLRSIYPFTRSRTADVPPGEYAVEYEAALLKYLQTPGASWQSCVVNEQCAASFNGYFAPIGLFYRLVHLYGIEATTRWTQFMAARQAAIPSPTDAQQQDAFFESYSAAANRNMNCALDLLGWPVSATARAWANTNFPAANPDCTTIGPGGRARIFDIQPDTMSTVDGSFNIISPGPGSSNFWQPTVVNVPVFVSTTAITNQSQFFRLGNAAGKRVRVHACAPATGFSGSTILWDAQSNGDLAGWGGPPVVRGNCSTVLWRAVAAVMIEQEPAGAGAYTLQAEANPYGAWPRPLWGRLSVTRNSQNRFTMTVSQMQSGEVLPTATHVRFWVQNYGWVTQVPWSAATSFSATWTPPAGETGDGLVFRAQVLAGTASGMPGQPAVPRGYASDQANAVVFNGEGLFADGFER